MVILFYQAQGNRLLSNNQGWDSPVAKRRGSSGTGQSPNPREKMKTRRHTDDTKKRLSTLNKGKVLSEETKKKMSQAQSRRRETKDLEDGTRKCLSCEEVKQITEFPRETRSGKVFYRRKCHECRRLDRQRKK